MEIDKDRVYSMGELKLILEKKQKEKEQFEKTEQPIVVNSNHLEDKDISHKNCIYLSTDAKEVVNILNRKLMYKEGVLWCPDHGNKCMIRKSSKFSYYPAYTCSLATTQASFGIGNGKTIGAHKRLPLFFYNFSSDPRKIIMIAALLQFEQMPVSKIAKFNNTISYVNCTKIKESLTRAQMHDTKTLQILQNHWNLFKRYCTYHKLNYLDHLKKIVDENPFEKSLCGSKKRTPETAYPVIFNPPKEVRAKVVVPCQTTMPSSLIQQPLSPTINEALARLVMCIEQEVDMKYAPISKEMESYKEDALKYRKMMEALNS